jgi:phosphopantothenoylcysteine decarboxylase / phosphopantothenate---cysteine ligase
MTTLQGKQIVLAVTGSISVYKAVDLASKLTQAGARVDVVMTDAAQQFVTPLTFQAVTGRTVYTSMWHSPDTAMPTHIAHVGLGESADLIAVVPATANTLAQLAHGAATDLLTVTALAARCPLLLAPAMDGGMYAHAAVQANLTTLLERGAHLVPPEEGRFASGLVGVGRLPATPTLIGHIRQVLGRDGRLAGRRVVVSAGGTREPLDPVRFITNHSSGKQGYAIAQAMIDAGAEVVLVTAAQGMTAPVGVTLVPVTTAQQMSAAILNHTPTADALVMAAAVSDYRPAVRADHKLKKGLDETETLSLALARNPDILMQVRQQREQTGYPRVVVGFAAESENLIENAQAKLARKQLDLLIANDITAPDAGFAAETNRVIVLSPGTDPEPLALQSKASVGAIIADRVAARLAVSDAS